MGISDCSSDVCSSVLWLNGIMAHARDYDDTHDAAVLHAGVSVVPAALAAADIAGRPVAGADLLAGLVAGLELICRLGMATGIGIIESGRSEEGRVGKECVSTCRFRWSP